MCFFDLSVFGSNQRERSLRAQPFGRLTGSVRTAPLLAQVWLGPLSDARDLDIALSANVAPMKNYYHATFDFRICLTVALDTIMSSNWSQ